MKYLFCIKNKKKMTRGSDYNSQPIFNQMSYYLYVSKCPNHTLDT